MSLRPSAKTEVRRNRYKVAVDADEGRRRREDNLVEIRKNKRDENLQKKRREGLTGSLAFGSAVEQPGLDLLSSATQIATNKPLKNLNVMLKLNPYAKTAKRMSLLAEEQGVKNLNVMLKFSWEEALAIRAAGKSWYQTMISDSDYTEFDNFTKWLGASQ